MTNDQKNTAAATTSNSTRFVFELATGETIRDFRWPMERPGLTTRPVEFIGQNETTVIFELNSTEDSWISTFECLTNAAKYLLRFELVDGEIAISSDRLDQSHQGWDSFTDEEQADIEQAAASVKAEIESWTDEERAAAKADCDAATASIKRQEEAQD